MICDTYLTVNRVSVTKTIQLMLCGTQMAAYFEVYTETHREGTVCFNAMFVQLRYRTPQTIVFDFCLFLYFTRRLEKQSS